MLRDCSDGMELTTHRERAAEGMGWVVSAERQAASYIPQVPTHLEFLQDYSMPV